MTDIIAIFFDLGDTLGAATVSGIPHRLATFDVFPYVPGVLSHLKTRGLHLGVISNTGSESGAAVNAVLAGDLAPGGKLANLEIPLLVYSGDEGVTKASPEIFHRAATRAQATPDRCLFVGEDTAERGVALSAGWSVCPHPLLVDEVLAQQPLCYVRVTVPESRVSTPWRQELHARAFVPLHIAAPRGIQVYGLTSQRIAFELINMRLAVELLGEPDLPLNTDLFLLRDDLARTTGFLSAEGELARTFAKPDTQRLILSSAAEGVVVAIPPTVERGVDEFHFDSARHGHTLKLVADPLLWEVPPPAAITIEFDASQPALSPTVLAELERIDPAVILQTIERYSGLRPLHDAAGAPTLTSRHILEAGNALAVDQLVRDLGAIGQGQLTVQLHPFTHAGRTLHNVEAELDGESPELVLVTAHLDSTAAADHDFDPLTDPAPGADDDASGVAAVLAIAERFVALAAHGTLARTVRFVLFNAEEQGLIGSRAYARRSKIRGESIAAVWQMDMVGFNAEPPFAWEVHVGFEPSPATEARSKVLANVLSMTAVQAASMLPPVQIHHSSSPGGDPAAGRSDHASFHAHGYPACAVSEDFFIDEPNSPAPDANPNYHLPSDTVIDEAYASAIARAVAAAAWVTASELAQPQ